MKRAPSRALSLLLSLTMLFGLCMPTAFAAESTYSDTANHWAEAAIARWSEYGVVQGSDGKFLPDAALTRAQMATILANTLGLTETGGNPFSDVAEDAWYAPYILSCFAAGVMQGSDGRANPDSAITRQEAMVMLGRALEIDRVDEPNLAQFTDSSRVADWAAPYVAAMVTSGMVGGVGNGQLAPDGNMSRAAMLTVLDRAVVQYVNKPGTYTMTDKDGIILVSAGDVTLTGNTSANILVTPAAKSKALTFDKATVTGEIIVQANGLKLTKQNSTLPDIRTTGEGYVMENTKPATGGGSGGSGDSGGSDPAVANLTIAQAKTVTGGTYQDVTITAAVADGTVTLDGVTIQGSLTIQGGGSSSINLTSCTVSGKVVMDKEGGEAPRLHLTNTPISQVEASKPAIIEADDATSAIAAVTAKANVEVKGGNTAISSITVPAAVGAPVAVTVTAGTVAKVEAKSETTVSGAAGSVAAVVAEAPVTVASDAVGKVEVPATAGAGVTVAVTGTEAVEVEVNSANGAAITAGDESKVNVSTKLDTPPENVTVGGTPVAHMHKWGAGVVTREPSCAQDGEKIYTCTAAGCADPAATKTEETPRLPHAAVNDPAVAATCTTPGKTEGSHCSVCNAVIVAQKAIPALGHTEVIDPAIAATCTTPGKTEGKHCSVCNAVITAQEGVPALGHTEVIDPAVAATCTTPGKTEGKHCSVCNAVITAQEAIAALGHDLTGAYLNDASGHWHKCSRCDETDTKAAHSYNTTSCSEAATCTVCAYEKAAGTHTWSEWAKVDDTSHKHTCTTCNAEETAAHTEVTDSAVAATCTTPGKTEGKHCSVCNAVMIAQAEIPAVGHSWGAWATADETSHKHTCSVCNAEATATHTWDAGVVTKEPTETIEGEKTFTCTACAATKTTVIPVIGADGKNGFDIAWSVSDGKLFAPISTPADASPDARYTIYVYNSVSGLSSYYSNCMPDYAYTPAISAGEYDRVRLYTSISGSDYSGETPLAEWELPKKIISRRGEDEFPHESVTVSVTPAGARYQYLFTGLDFSTYGYTLTNPSTKQSLQFNTASMTQDNRWIGAGMQLKARQATQTETEFILSETKPYTIDVLEAT